MRKSFFFLAFLFILIGCKDTDSSENIENIPEVGKSWELVTSEDNSKPVARHEAAFAKLGTKFYLLGGRGIRPISIYDTSTKTWQEGSEPPLELHHFQPIIFENKIYIIGAFTGGWPSETPTSHIYLYDPETDEWSQGDEIPEDRRRGSTGNVLYNGMVYVSCGIKDGHRGDHKRWMDRYDPNTGEWEILADAPMARDHFQAVVSGNQIYMTAGRNTGITDSPFGGTIGQTDVYTIDNNTWETLSNDIPTKRAGNAAILYNGEILVIGGESDTQGQAHDEVEALDLNAGTWRSLESMVQGRHGTGVIEFESSLFVASGCGRRGGEPELETMEKYSSD